MNRLNLDFSLKYTDERARFVEEYLKSQQFQNRPPTNEECETIANYILWGRKQDSGKNVVQEKEIQIKTRAGLWEGSGAQIESLDGLLEQPGFSEQQIVAPNTPKWRYPKETFSRASVRQDLRSRQDDSLLDLFENLWRRIDSLDLELNFYDLEHGKREKPPRAELLAQFTEDEIAAIRAHALVLNQFKYLKKRHLLVELRREQYTLRDTYTQPVQQHATQEAQQTLNPIYIDADIPCAPCGLYYSNDSTGLWKKIFPEGRYPAPSDFTKSELSQILRFYWRRKEFCREGITYFDFTNEDHITRVFNNFDLLNENEETDVFSNTKEFHDTLNFYIARANLSPAQQLILQLKIQKKSNEEISKLVEQEFGKAYTINYISTIFRQKIIPSICEAAKIHAEVIENLPYPENFKVCKTCGKIMLINEKNFVHKARAADGFSSQCKRCDKEARQIAKEKIK